MRIVFWLSLAASLCLAAVASAQDYSEPSGYYTNTSSSRVDELEARVMDLERQLASAGVDGGCGGSCCDPCCRGQGWFGSAQAIWLKPYNSAGTGLAFIGDPSVPPGSIDTDYEVSPRLEAGYARCDGLGFRVRYWEYDHAFAQSGFDFGAGPATVGQGWDTWVADFEITDSTKLGCNWDATFAVGYRHVEYSETLLISGVPSQIGGDFIVDKSSTGDGLTVAAELRRCVSCNWGIFANTRGSALYGDEALAADSAGMSFLVVEKNNVKYIWEAQAGLEWTRCIPCGGYVYARGFGEVQYWDSFGLPSISGVTGFSDSSVGFAGFGVALGLVR